VAWVGHGRGVAVEPLAVEGRLHHPAVAEVDQLLVGPFRLKDTASP